MNVATMMNYLQGVCKVVVPDGSGSGFLTVVEDKGNKITAIMTNNHVIESATVARNSKALFYDLKSPNKIVAEIRLRSDVFFKTSKYFVVQCLVVVVVADDGDGDSVMVIVGGCYDGVMV